jgi:hypothetical protein
MQDDIMLPYMDDYTLNFRIKDELANYQHSNNDVVGKLLVSDTQGQVHEYNSRFIEEEVSFTPSVSIADNRWVFKVIGPSITDKTVCSLASVSSDMVR